MSAKADEYELVTKLDKMFSTALSHPTWVNWRANAEKCHKYKEGDQWTPDELATLQKRNQPPTVNNQVKVTLDRMIGQFVKQRSRIGYRGRNYPQDTAVAQTLSDIFLFVKQNNGLEYEEREMADDGFTDGMGVLEAYISFNDLFKPEIKIRHVDALEILPDPFSRRYDWNDDANYIIRFKWSDAEEAAQLYPAKRKELEAMIDKDSAGLLAGIDSFKRDNYIDPKQRRVRLVEIWYKDKQRESIWLHSDGSADLAQMKKGEAEAYKKKYPQGQRIDRIRTKMRVGIYTGGILLEDKESPFDHSYFPFIPYFTQRKKDGEPYSLILTALSLQDAINKRESKAISLLTQNQSIFRKGIIADKVELANEMAKPDGQIELQTGRFGEDFIIEKNIDLAQTQFSLHQESKNDFRRVTGINPDALGEKSEVRSGVGIARKQQMTDIIIAPVFDNFRRTRAILARIVLELVKQYWTEEMIFYVTDDLQAARAVTLDIDKLKAIKENIYDVIVDDLPDTTTVQQEVFESLSQSLPQILQYGPGWAALLVQMSDLPKKDAIIQQIQAMGQPQPEKPKFSISMIWDNLSPQEKAVFAEKELMLPELAQAVLSNPTPPTAIIKAQAGMVQNQQKAQAENQRSQADIMKSQMELSHTAQKNQMEMQHAQDKHQLDMAKAHLEVQKAHAMAMVPQNNGGKSGN